MNSFLSGVMACVGTIVLLVCLRLHVNPKTKLPTDSPEKIYAEYLIASFILYFVCINFMGQLKSTLICSECKKPKLKFEPFSSVELPKALFLLLLKLLFLL